MRPLNNPNYDMLHDVEIEEAIELKHIRRINKTGCSGCDFAQQEAGNNTALCKKHEQEFMEYHSRM